MPAPTDEKLGRKTRAPERGLRVTGPEKGVKARTWTERLGKSNWSKTDAEKHGRGARMRAPARHGDKAWQEMQEEDLMYQRNRQR